MKEESVAGSCVHGNEPSDSVKAVKSLTI
jgi:hypothetical protein